MVYSRYNGNDISLIIENNDNDPYTRIGEKAFLSCKGLVDITIPNTVTEIGNWAFSHMKDLCRLNIPANSFHIGKDVFLKCDNLKEICIYPDESGVPGLKFLFAISQTVMKDVELFQPNVAASSEENKKWLELFDEKLLRYVYMPDEHGFQSVLIGWFDDEGEEEQLLKYVKEQKYKKAGLCISRLMYDTHLEKYTRDRVVSYLKSQIDDNSMTDSCPAGSYIVDNCKYDIEMIKAIEGSLVLSDSSRNRLLEVFIKQNADPEVISYLISRNTANRDESSVDSAFEQLMI